MRKIFVFIITIIAFTLIFYLPRSSNNNNFKEIVIREGEHLFLNGIVVDSDEILIIRPGARLVMGNNTKIIVNGRIVAIGSSDDNIEFESIDGYWRGIEINGTNNVPDINNYWDWFIGKSDKTRNSDFFQKIKNGNVFKNCVFKNISTESRKFVIGNKWKSAIEAYDTSVSVLSSTFDDVLHIGGVLSQRSYVLVSQNNFTSNQMHKSVNCTDNSVVIVNKNNIKQNRSESKRCADGIWINSSVALISGNDLVGIADDGIDTDNSSTIIINNNIDTVFDDGIDIDKSGKSFVIKNRLNNVGENCVLASDGSGVVLTENSIEGCDVGVAVRDGSGVVGSDLIIANNSMGSSLFMSFPCVFSKKDYLAIVDRIMKMTDFEIGNLKITNIFSKEDMLRVIDDNYENLNGNYYYNKNNIQKDVQEVFKVLGNFVDINDNQNVALNDFCKKLKNSLYLTSTKFKNNKDNILVLGSYKLKFEDTIFDNKDSYSSIEKLFTDNFSCELVDMLNTSPIVSMSNKIINEIDRLDYE